MSLILLHRPLSTHPSHSPLPRHTLHPLSSYARERAPSIPRFLTEPIGSVTLLSALSFTYLLSSLARPLYLLFHSTLTCLIPLSTL